MLILTSAFILLLAWSNGANDISKGVATLVGNGQSSARKAVLWGTFWTLCGGLAAILWGTALIKTFSTGYLSETFNIDLQFILSTAVGASLWVWFATRKGLPVSTTHALLGGLIGAVLLNSGLDGLQGDAVARKAMLPLLIGPLIAIALCAVLLLITRQAAKHVPQWIPGCCDIEDWRRDPSICATANPDISNLNSSNLNTPNKASSKVETIWRRLHWASGATTSFARGLNDVPKIAAFLILTASLAADQSSGQTLGQSGLFLSTIPPELLILSVALTMGLGCLWGGFKVLNILATGITPVNSSTGVLANVGTSVLVLAASPLGLPVSTTHVSAGSLMGVRWQTGNAPPLHDALKLILFGWVITLPITALFAAATSLLLNTTGWAS